MSNEKLKGHFRTNTLYNGPSLAKSTAVSPASTTASTTSGITSTAFSTTSARDSVIAT